RARRFSRTPLRAANQAAIAVKPGNADLPLCPLCPLWFCFSIPAIFGNLGNFGNSALPLTLLDIRLTLFPMPIDYMQMLLDLMEERQKGRARRDEAVRKSSRLSELIRATVNMIPPEQLARYEPIFERIEQRPLGLAVAIRACFTVENAI